MSLDSTGFASLISHFVEAPAKEHWRRSLAQESPIQSQLLAASRAIHLMATRSIDSSTALTTSSQLFDSLARQSWPDPFGERYEVCLSLAFMGWRSALELGDESAAQEWLRVAEVIGCEDFEAKESLASFLLLDGDDRSTGRFSAFVENGIDAFLALAILRDLVRRVPLRGADAAAALFDWVALGNLGDLRQAESAYLCAEIALVRMSGLRVLGLSRETTRCLSIVRAQLPKLRVSKLFRAKILAFRIAEAYRRNRVTDFSLRAGRVADFLARFGMHRENLICRTALAFSLRARGQSSKARQQLEELVGEVRYSSDQLFRAVLLGNLGELDAQQGRRDAALYQCREAIQIASDQGCDLILGTVLLNLAEVQLFFGEQDEAMMTARRAIDLMASTGAGTWLAYARIWMADVLLGLNRIDEARSELLLALVTVQNENMPVEGIHALKLLGDIESRASSTSSPYGRDALKSKPRLS